MEVISRKYYADKIDSWLGKEAIIVLTGQRRVGKSYILKDFIRRHQDEFGRLRDIKNDYPKFVISLSPILSSRDYEGITHLGLREFLKYGL